ncbi:MAG: succinylglutamate desuccinylase/aspartoacylase family protein [Cardiobacteriaceae bacterium]|nr:succinylglutamate desuccinylase/aspartoacylase family protein [Cardiobacteriaceae bacterium]
MTPEKLILDAGSPGSHTSLAIWRYGRAGSGPKVYVQAALHADEWPGVLMLHHLHHLLEQAEITGEIVVVPIANPIGLRQFLGGYQLGRFDFDYSGNFNRGYLELADAAYPLLQAQHLQALDAEAQKKAIRAAFREALDNWQPQLEAERLRKELQLLAHDADAVIDVHCDAVACAHAFASRRHQAQAEALAQCMALEVLLLEDDLYSMAFDEAFAAPWWRLADKLGLAFAATPFATTLELRGERDIDEATAQRDAANFLRFLQYLGAVAGEAAIAEAPPLATPLDGVARITAPHAGLLQFHVAAGAHVQEGQAVVDLIDPLDPRQPRLTLHAPVAGTIYALGRNHMVRPGHVVAQIAGKTARSKAKLAY